MKMLFYRYGSICEKDIMRTFEEFGIEIIVYDKEVIDKNYPVERAVTEVAELLEENKVLFVFSINFFPFLSEMTRIFNIRYLTWVVDSPVLELYSKTVANDNNRIFIFDRTLAMEISKYNSSRVFHLPLGARLEERNKMLNTEDVSKYKHNVSFVGSLYTEKNPLASYLKNMPEFYRGYLEGLIDCQEWCYGAYFLDEVVDESFVKKIKPFVRNFEDINSYENLSDKVILSQYYLGAAVTAKERIDTFRHLSDNFEIDIYTYSDTSEIKNIHNHGNAKTETEMPFIFRNSRININTTSKSIRTGVSLRVYDVLSCKGFLISNYQQEIAEMFEVGKCLETYSTLDELDEKIEYFLSHEKERRDISEAGYEFLEKNYTMKKQLTRMLEMAFDN